MTDDAPILQDLLAELTFWQKCWLLLKIYFRKIEGALEAIKKWHRTSPSKVWIEEYSQPGDLIITPDLDYTPQLLPNADGKLGVYARRLFGNYSVAYHGEEAGLILYYNGKPATARQIEELYRTMGFDDPTLAYEHLLHQAKYYQEYPEMAPYHASPSYVVVSVYDNASRTNVDGYIDAK